MLAESQDLGQTAVQVRLEIYDRVEQRARLFATAKYMSNRVCLSQLEVTACICGWRR